MDLILVTTITNTTPHDKSDYPYVGQIISPSALLLTQRGREVGCMSCQLEFLVFFTRITKRDTTLNHLHPVETMTGPILHQICYL